MFRKIMVPIDLTHIDKQSRALSCAAELAKTFSAPVVYAGVTSELPGALAHSPKEYAAKLDAFASEQAEKYGIETAGHCIVGHDVAVDLDRLLLHAIPEVGADLVVMASHIPHRSDYIWPSNGGRVATHADVSVMVVREAH